MRLFELSSGNKLHRDRVTGKCKVLPLGRWRNTLQQEDIGHPHFRLTDRLSMVGVELLASWQQTRKVNNDELLKVMLFKHFGQLLTICWTLYWNKHIAVRLCQVYNWSNNEHEKKQNLIFHTYNNND